mmetsp:Transcript_13835/g.16808  ORF Transcript_13835/g.16808 Transcript_13835/m.16808 type:complete len:420 (-) Transcript_13835:226-1485(-)
MTWLIPFLLFFSKSRAFQPKNHIRPCSHHVVSINVNNILCSGPLNLSSAIYSSDEAKNEEVFEYDYADQKIWENQNSSERISNLLVCGDGDLSFAANIAESLSQVQINLMATVLEPEHTHRDVYERSASNEQIITSFEGHEVKYGVDATKLEDTFGDRKFDRIIFNFPHWRGKANHRYNRQLIDSFFKSASQMLSPRGEIHVALCEGQGGGSDTRSLKEYRDTWTPAFFGSSYDLLLTHVMSFQPNYNLSSHRGVDRGFKVGSSPEMYIFCHPNYPDLIVDRNLQMSCRHELHVVLPDELDDVDNNDCSSQYSISNIVVGNAIEKIVQSIVPEGIRVEVPERCILLKEKTGYEFNMVTYLVVYSGEGVVLRRDQADKYRHAAELEVEKHIILRENRRGRLVSRPFPYYLLQSIIEDHTI